MFKCDKLQLLMAHFTLSVHKKVPLDAIRGELGIHPMGFIIVKRMFDFYCRAESQLPDSLLGQAFIEAKKIRGSWFTTINKLLSVGETVSCESGKISELLPLPTRCDTMLRNLRAAFDRAWLDAICKQGAKLRTYSLFKTHFQAECYLSKVRIAAHRFSLSRLRMSGHFLRIETGRFQRHSHIPASERFCKLCNTGEVEDEFHFLIRCPLYKALRENLYTAADLSCKNF